MMVEVEEGAVEVVAQQVQLLQELRHRSRMLVLRLSSLEKVVRISANLGLP